MKKHLTYLISAVVAVSFVFVSCSDDENGNNIPTSWFDGTLTAVIQNGSSYNNLIDSVIGVGLWETANDWGSEIIAQGSWSNGSFTITLPETLDSRFLFRINDEVGDLSTVTISDRNAGIANVRFGAVDANSCIVGSFHEPYVERENAWEEFFIVFADRDVTITGEYTWTDTWEGVTYTDTEVWNVSLRRGWNWLRGAEREVRENHWQFEITTMSPPSGLRWHFDDWGPEWIECPPGDQQAITITATNVPALGVQRVRAATWDWNEMPHTVASSSFSNNGFSLLLSETPHPNTLEPIGTMSGFTVSNPNARTASVWEIEGFSSATGAFLDGDFAGWFLNAKIVDTDTEFSIALEIYMYADRDVSVTGTVQGSGWRETVDVDLVPGWNKVFQTFGAELVGQDFVEFGIMTSTPVSGLTWMFEPVDFPISTLSSEYLVSSVRQRMQERNRSGLLRGDTQNVEQSPAPTVSRTAPTRELREPSRGFSNRSERASRRGR